MNPCDMSDDQLLEAFFEALEEGHDRIDELTTEMTQRRLLATA